MDSNHPFNSKHCRNTWRVASQERQSSPVFEKDDSTILPISRDHTVDTVSIRDDDPRLQRAMHVARATFQEFLIAFADRLPDDFFAVKGLFTDDFGKEYLWIKPVILGDEFITGILDNTPKVVRTVRHGQTVRILRKDLFDWLYVTHGTRYGAYTVEALEQILNPRKAA